MATDLFSATECDRCAGELTVRIMSWFTKETICMVCSAKESVVKNKLRENGDSSAYEGCGFVPKI